MTKTIPIFLAAILFCSVASGGVFVKQAEDEDWIALSGVATSSEITTITNDITTISNSVVTISNSIVDLDAELTDLMTAVSNIPLAAVVVTNDISFNLAVLDTWYPVTFSKVAATNGVITATTSNITIGVEGWYDVGGAASFSGQNNQEVEIALFIDDVEQDYPAIRRRLGVAGDVGSAAATIYPIYLYEDQVLTFKAKSTDVTGNITFERGAFACQRKGGAGVTQTQLETLQNATIVFDTAVLFGDSNTGGSSNPSHKPDDLFPEILAGWFPSATVTNAGVSGDETTDVLARLDSYTNFVSDSTFDVAGLMIGVNDFAAAKSLDDTISDFETLLDAIIADEYDYVFVIGYYAWNTYTLPLRAYNKACRDLCIEKGVGWIDLDFRTVDTADGYVHQDYYWGDGNQHLNQTGHNLLARLARERLLSSALATASDTAYPFDPSASAVSTFDALVAADFEQTEGDEATEYTAPATLTGLSSTVAYAGAVRGGAVTIATNDVQFAWSGSASTNGLTIAVAFSVTNSAVAFERLHKYSGGAVAANLTFRPASNLLEAYVAATGNKTIIDSLLFDGEWHLAVMRVNPSETVTLWVDGLFVSDEYTTSTDYSSVTTSYIGSETDGSLLLSGSADDVYVWPRPLTDREVRAIYTAFKSGSSIFRTK